RSAVLRMRFDGDETVWCPLGDFFGSGVGLNPFKGKYRQVSADGTLRCRWVMPYRRSAEVTIENLGEKTVNVKIRAVVGNWDWDERSMYFHANWRYEYPLATRPRQDWNYIEARGRGVYMGDTLTVMNPVVGWWGEGDEKIWVDGDTFPSHFGTGTEDYYGYAWGGHATAFYERPFHAQIVAGANKTHGYNVQTRTRALDAIPFKEKIKLDMEVWHPREVETAYAVGTYWYGFGGVKFNRGAESAQARRTIPQPPPAPPAPERPRRAAAGPGLAQKVPGAIEFEGLKPAKVSDGAQVLERGVKALRWSGGKQLLIRGSKAGDFVEFEIDAEDGGERKLLFHGTKGPNYGKCRLRVQGKLIDRVFDFHYSSFVKTGPIDLGVFTPERGRFVLRFEATQSVSAGQEPRSFVGLDCIVFEKP
ncbi:MAG: DUF2961 domain-containing protein, partial [Planctomycetes bacterium]|nr:DUF2961 domain-containing protein [Planctomycetota bacterium]